MKKYLQKKLNNEKGMTLIELLAVIVIIAIIAAIAIPAIANVIENSRVGATKSDAQNIISAAAIANADLNDSKFEIVSGTENELQTGDYINDMGSFSSIEIVELNADGEWLLTGTATAGDYTINFNGASKSDIEGLKNNARPTTAGGKIVFSE